MQNPEIRSLACTSTCRFFFCLSHIINAHSLADVMPYIIFRDADKFVAFLKTKNMRPEAAQVHVQKNQLETYIDAVVLDEKKRRFVVEVKTGFHGYHELAAHRCVYTEKERRTRAAVACCAPS